jgi:hypothetical protein
MTRLKHILKTAVSLVGMCLLLGVISSQAANLTVNTTADAGIGSLRQAIIDATGTPTEADVINFSISTTDPGFDAVENRFTINLLNPLPNIPLAAMTINNDQPHGVTVKGNNTFRIFTLVNSAVVIINNLTISNGFSNGQVGGGIYMGNSSTLSLNNSAVSNNAASGNGGGIYMSNSATLFLANTTITSNTALNGGGIFIFDSGTLNIDASTVNANSTAAGGSGGGVFNGTFGTINAINSTFDGNTARGGNGGGIYNSATMTLNSNTITSNTANAGGGIFNNFTATLKNNIVALNTALDGNDLLGRGSRGLAFTGEYNLVGNADGSEGLEPPTNQLGSTLNPINPQIGFLNNNGGATLTRALLNGSPAIDKGDSPGIITDQRGFFRPVDDLSITNTGNGADIGAFERENTTGGNYSISGTVTYGIVEMNQTPQRVSGVNLSATGESAASVFSDFSGDYELTNLLSGDYTVTPSKTGDVNGINSLDATRIQQYRVGLITLSAAQLVAADTDNSGTINSLDATRIQQYQVGIQSNNIIGQWKFLPTSRQYSPLTGNLTGENYQAVLVGEVSGNWTRPADFAQSTQIEESKSVPTNDNQNDVITSINARSFGNRTAQSTGKSEKQSADLKVNDSGSDSAAAGLSIAVSLPANATASVGNTIVVPVSIGEIPAGGSVESFDFSVFYDPAVLQINTPAGSNTGTLSSGCSVFANAPTAGKVIVSGACGGGAITNGPGTLYNLTFTVIGAGNETSSLTFVNPADSTNTFVFNNSSPSAVTTNGQFSVIGPTAASVSVSGRVMTQSGRSIRNVQITLTDSNGNKQTARTTSFGYYRFDNVTAGETVTLSAKARQFRFSQSTIVRTTNESINNADFVSEQ